MQSIEQSGGIILNPKGQIAIITSTKGLKTFPKGSCEPGETYLETAKREIYEETGIKDIRLRSKLGILVRPGYTADNHSEPSVIKNIHVFFFTSNTDELQPQMPDVLDAEWVSINKVKKVLSWPEEREFFEKQRARLKL